MSKDKLLRLLMKINLVFVLLITIVLLLFIDQFPKEMYGTVSTTIFQTVLTYNGEDYVINNLPLYVVTFFFVFNGLLLIYALVGEKVQKSLLVEASLYNVILSFFMVVSAILFTIFLPEMINGLINHGIFVSHFHIRTDEIKNVYNFNYALLFIFFGWNVFVLNKTKDPSVIEEEEDIF